MKFFLVLVLATISCAADAGTGSWKVLSVAGSAPISAMSDEQAAKLVGSTLAITKDMVRFAGQTCSEPSLKITPTTRADFYRGYKMLGNPLKLPDNFATEDLGCTTLVRLSSRKALFYWEGYFYSATLKIPEHQEIK